MATQTQLIDDYLNGIKTLKQAAAGMSREQVLARPIPGKWSTLEVVCHIADFEPVFADRIKRVLALDNPTLLGADQDRFASTLAYQDRDLEEELALVELTRKQLARILKKQPAEALARTGTHNERGPLSVEKLLMGATNHINHHVKFIAEKRKALGV
jgi:uncharacterized damage-inducible protein DinB